MASGNIATSGSKQVNTWFQFNLFKQVVHGTANAATSVIAAATARIRASSKNNDINLWSRGYELAQQRQGELMKDFTKYLETLHMNFPPDTDRNVMNLSYAECVVNSLFAIRKKNGIHLSVPTANTKIREEIEKLAKFLLQSDSFVQRAVNTEPHTALAWSGVSLFLLAVSNSQVYNIDMLKSFNTVNDMQILWKDFEETYLASPHYRYLRDPLAQLYSYIIEYQATAICHASKPPVSCVFRFVAESNNWTELITSIKNMEEICLSYITGSQQAEMYEINKSQLQAIEKQVVLQGEILQNLKNNTQDDMEQKLLCNLAKVSGDYQRHKNINPRRVPGTCEWFLADERFCKWRDCQTEAFLWVSAGPGCGKSVLSRALIEEGHLMPDTTITIEPSAIMASHRPSVICYFFFKEGGPGQMDVSQALCAILQQLFQHPLTSNLIAHALPSHRIHQDTLTQKVEELWQILIECAKSSSAEIVCVLDALDECSEDRRKEFVGMLKELYNPSNVSLIPSRLKFLITSRPYENLGILFDRFSPSMAYLHFDGDDKSGQISKEINLVIDIKLNDIARDFSEQDRDRISHRLKSMENRTYLWLHLTLGIIEGKMSSYSRGADIEELLSQLPSQVVDAYEKILSRSQDIKKVETILQIILVATRPLTLDEANCALTLALEKEPLSSEEKLRQKLWPKTRFKATLQNLCGLFISVHDSSLSFIHQTAREFLIHPEQKGTWKGRLNLSKSHGILSEACIKYLQILDPSCQHPKDEYPFFSYAAETWPLHFRLQDADSTEMLRKLARELCRVSSPRTRLWIQGSSLSYYKKEFLDLHLASYLGLAAILHDMIVYEHADATDQEIECGKTPLHEIEITEAVIKASMQTHYLETLKLVWYSINDREITARVVVAAGDACCQGPANIPLLLSKGGHKIKMTEDILKAAVGNRFSGLEIITFLLDKYGHEIEITEGIVEAAVRNDKQGLEIVGLLLDKRGHEITITEHIVKEVLRNWYCGLDIMSLLLDERGNEIRITKDIIMVAQERGYQKDEMLALLQKGGGGEEDVIEEEF